MKIIENIIIFGVLISAMGSFKEYSQYLSGILPHNFELTPFYIKVIKDILLCSVMVILSVQLLMKRHFFFIPSKQFFLFIITILSSYILSFAFVSPIFATIGLRTFLPIIILTIVGYNLRDEDRFIGSVTKVFIIVAVIEIILSIYQIFFQINFIYYNTEILSLFGTNLALPILVGTLGGKSSLAIFLCIAIALLYSANLSISKKLRVALITIFTLFTFLTRSVSGLIGLFSIFFIRQFLKRRFLYLCIISLLFVFILYNIEFITSRKGWMFGSGIMRYLLLKEYVLKKDFLSILAGQGLGVGSNTGVLINKYRPIEIDPQFIFISDSLYISLITQIGLFGLLIFILLNIDSFVKALKMRYPPALYLIPLFLITGIGVLVQEFFPFNWIYGLVVGITLKKYRIFYSKTQLCT